MHLTRKAVSLLGLAALTSLGLVAAPAAHAQTNLLTNGSFEQGTFTDNGHGAQAFSPGATTMPGWTTTNAELAWLFNTNGYGLSTPYGSYFLDLTGYHDASPYGGVTQTITTTNGTRYALTFSIGSDQDYGPYAGAMSVTASAGSTSQTFTFTPAVGSTGNQWKAFELDFTATGTSTPITLTGTSTAGGQYLGLDNVSVTGAPEPSQTAAFGLGVLGLSVLAFKARRRGHIS